MLISCHLSFTFLRFDFKVGSVTLGYWGEKAADPLQGKGEERSINISLTVEISPDKSAGFATTCCRNGLIHYV